MANNLFSRLRRPSRSPGSSHEECHSCDADVDLENSPVLTADEHNLQPKFSRFDAEAFGADDSHVTIGSNLDGMVTFLPLC
ncbi:hypothetical protein XA68_10331 [Ophiocordyceps unilateralis]|uniref:Uncharacterized protein n=1 Tax=Ophiocordyceps unilateralis TaxID=268505 RepID=A0A2A9P2X2_OPHUN|nr:hypothetical protein XA68_10331 [Ophiocordyceps unilateralis]